MHWFYVEKSQIAEGEIVIKEQDAYHIRHVLRMKPGDKITICDAAGTDYYCTIKTIKPEYVVAGIDESNDSESELPAKIYLFQGIPKKDKMELVIQKAVELGAFEVIPVAMKRCIVKLEDSKKEQKKLERWQAIAASASKQCGRGMIPRVHGVLNLKEAVQYARNLEYIVVPYEQEKDISFSYETIKKACQKKSIGIFIGPEGGFEEEEIVCLKEAGMETITLGKRILRTETAGMTLLSILMFHLERRREELAKDCKKK